MSDTDTKVLPQKVESTFKAYDGAELELKLCKQLRARLDDESLGVEHKLEDVVTRLDTDQLRSLKKSADFELVRFRGAQNLVAKLSGATQRGVDLQEALDTVAAVKARLPELEELVTKGQSLLDGVKALQTEADKWEKEQKRYAVRTELDGLRQQADEVLKLVGQGDVDKALLALARGKDLMLDGKVKKQMSANQVPSVPDIKAIIARKDGDKQLDEMIKNLDESTQRKVITVAFEARFGCKLQILSDASYNAQGKFQRVTDGTGDGIASANTPDKKAPELRRFYDLMSKLPAKHTRENTGLLKFRYRDSDKSSASFASARFKDIVMNEGRADKSGVYGVGRPDEMPADVKDECKPANDEPITFFDWNTAHEVGHTLDAKLGFMVKRANQSQFGGWREYGKDNGPVVAALAKRYDFDATYIKDLLTTGAGTLPPAPPGVDAVEWNLRHKQVDAHYARMVAGKNPWSSQATAVSLAIDGRVYQQSYDWPHWSSYELAARQQAISGYQFRSPLEWFSEMYAAYKSNKLKPNHPAMEWLKRLDAE
ncbi:hypothetical protein [Pelomonas sp. KK5]|uniref:hypothetical protein n=1 Tax=Pelomonas sp. KK5 TaxID=1855730 RepID=UPI00097CBFB2|nr:hypothetical protein [Pelomonas sp. KK5]